MQQIIKPVLIEQYVTLTEGPLKSVKFLKHKIVSNWHHNLALQVEIIYIYFNATDSEHGLQYLMVRTRK